MEIQRDNLAVFSRVVGPIQTSIYILGCRKTNQAVIIDGGGDAKEMMATIDEQGWDLNAIWQTHAHIDHVAGLNDLRELTEAPILLHPLEQPVYDAAVQQGLMFGFQIEPLPSVDQYVEEGQVVNVGQLEAKIMLLPGHSPGSVAFYLEEEGLFFGGDVIFAGSVGRVDLPGSSPQAMRQSLQRVAQLPDDTIILPGHGPTTTIAQEKQTNPFLRGLVS